MKKVKVDLYRDGLYSPYWNFASGENAACGGCLEELFVIPEDATEITLEIRDKRFAESYEVILHSSSSWWYRMETFTDDNLMRYHLSDFINKHFPNKTTLYIGVHV